MGTMVLGTYNHNSLSRLLDIAGMQVVEGSYILERNIVLQKFINQRGPSIVAVKTHNNNPFSGLLDATTKVDVIKVETLWVNALWENGRLDRTR
jgi:hypothetical protein